MCRYTLFVCQTCLHNAAYKTSHLTPDTAELVLYDFMVKVELSCSDAPLRIVTFSLPLSHLWVRAVILQKQFLLDLELLFLNL